MSTEQSKPSSSRAQEHAARAFAPEDVLFSSPVVQGPFTDTSASDPLPPQAEVVGVEVVLGEKERAEASKWNEERIERRLRGEYERAGRQLSELVHDNLDTPLRLNAIRIVGANSTRASFLSSLVAPYLPTLPPASYLSSSPHPDPAPTQTLRSLLSTTRDVSGLFAKFDIFKEIDASLEASPSVLAEAEDVDIVLRVKEASKYFLRTATDIGDGEGSATGTARIRNAFGGAEMLEGNVSFGTRTKNAFQLRLDTPVAGSPVTKADFSIFSAQRDLNYYASCSESTKGARACLRTVSPFGFHEVAYEAILRQIGDVLPAASMSVRDAAGQSVKSSISHTFTRDTRDDPFVATKGSYLKLKQEYAGLGGDASFIKTESESSISRAIGAGCTLSLGYRSGFLLPLGGAPSLFADRYHLGGPTSVRMFRPNSMGPKDSGDYIGGDLHWATGLSMTTPFPRKPDWPLKTHLFLNAGRLTRVEQDKSLASSFGNLLSQPSVTAGFGLMYRHSLVRIEANVGVPLAMGKQEGGVKGLQFGLGLSFL